MRAAAATALAFLACHPMGAKGDDCLTGPHRNDLLQVMPSCCKDIWPLLALKPATGCQVRQLGKAGLRAQRCLQEDDQEAQKDLF